MSGIEVIADGAFDEWHLPMGDIYSIVVGWRANDLQFSGVSGSD
jgi:hypothetical protein